MDMPQAAILLALLAIAPQTEPLTDHVDLIELNHFHDQCGREVFQQIIFWDFHERHGTHEIVAWRMYKSRAQLPQKNYATGEWVATWVDTQHGQCLRRVISKTYRVTRTIGDPETEDRERLPRESRRELRRVGRPVPPPPVPIE